MTLIEKTTIDRIIGCTMSQIDQHKCLAALAYARDRDIEPECLTMILNARRSWLNWITRTQRQWQRDTRNPNKARHHDSIEIRERYVRC